MSGPADIKGQCVAGDGVISAVVEPRPRDLGGFAVERILPAVGRRHLGPFVFFDHMGSAAFSLAPGHGMDVRPHPHIGLATVTYLFAGSIDHRDTLGSFQTIRPGDINWMVAGRGIAHSERTGAEHRRTGSRVHGLQLWVALPLAHEDTAPAFFHHPGDTLPALDHGAARLRVLVGEAYGARSPVKTFSPTFYVDAALAAGGELHVPGEYAERAAYVVDGAIACGADHAEAGRMLVFASGADIMLRATRDTRLVLVGGAAIDGERQIWWNFVASSKERIEQAKREWREGGFGKVHGDEVERIPLPE